MRWQPVAAVFRRRARDEADRYGTDPWVFVRELLQNARDAGATRVILTVEQDGDLERVSCHDDGEGMSFAESREFLFTLYASSKSELSGQAGQFGVGFWSVLRFEPSAITVRSQPEASSGWQVRLDGNLETVEHRRIRCAPGTEVILERRRQQADLAERIYRAAVADARFLRCRDDSSQALEILVNGRHADATFALPAPSLVFHRKGLRGAVGLGRQPKVELFVHGLRVRDAVSLDELLTEDRAAGSRLTEMPQGLVPRVLLDSDRLEVLLARADAREDRRLRRYVRIAECELAGLVRRQLDRVAPVGPLQRLLEAGRSLCSRPRIKIKALLPSVLLLTVVALVVALTVWQPEVDLPVLSRLRSWTSHELPSPTTEMRQAVPYADLGDRYSGPSVDAFARTSPVVDLQYTPPQPKLLLAVLLITEMSEQGRPETGLNESRLVPYKGLRCREGCIRIELGTDQRQGLMRLPVPTGYLVDTSSVRAGEAPAVIMASPLGEPVIAIDSWQSRRVHYQVGPAPELAAKASIDLVWPQLPADLTAAARGLQRLTISERLLAARQLVRSRAKYDRSPIVAQMHQAAARQGSGLITSALAIGAGDCDVINTILVAVLREAGVPARLAIGHVGIGGSVLPGMHAWVEALDEQGRWRVVDASTVAGQARGGPVPVPPGPGAQNLAPALPRLDQSPVATGNAWLLPVLMSGMALVLASSAIFLLAGRWTSRTVQLDQSTDLAALLGGALRQPEAFRQVQSLFSRKLVPQLGGSTISVKRARRYAARGRLFRSRHSRLAEKAAARGAAVIDAAQPAGEVVADLLGANDLDHWDRLLARRVAAPFVQTVNRILRESGERWQVRVAAGASEALTTLDLNALALGRRVPAKLVMIASDTALCTAASSLFAARPWQAVLMVVDAAVHHLDLPVTRRAQVLGPLASRAVAEKESV
jgi:transglutaminase-like putative cysteine protease